MIRYALICDAGHVFESWFRSSDTFDTLVSTGQVSCAVCGSARVEKAPMAPALGRAQKRTPAPERRDDQPAPKSAPMPSAEDRGARPDLAALRAKIEAISDDVGRDFAAEARAIHDGEAPARPIRGEATAEEARALAADDVPVLPLPWWQRRDD